MAAKIYVHQQAIFHADTLEELVELRRVATEAIEQGGGAVEGLSDMDRRLDRDGDTTYVQTIDYLVLRTAV